MQFKAKNVFLHSLYLTQSINITGNN